MDGLMDLRIYNLFYLPCCAEQDVIVIVLSVTSLPV